MTKVVSRIFLLLAALAMPPAAIAQSTGALLFEDVTPIRVDANALVVEMLAQPPKEYPHVGYRAPLSLEEAVNIWAKAHFHLTGAGENTLRITVREADIVEKLLPVKRGISGWFRKDQAAEYTARLDIAVTVIDANGQPQGMAEAKSWHSTTVAEGATEDDKRSVWMDMIKRTVGNLNREIQPRIRQALARHVE